MGRPVELDCEVISVTEDVVIFELVLLLEIPLITWLLKFVLLIEVWLEKPFITVLHFRIKLLFKLVWELSSVQPAKHTHIDEFIGKYPFTQFIVGIEIEPLIIVELELVTLGKEL